MDVEPSAEQRQLVDSVHRFLADHAPLRPYVRDLLDDARGTTDEVWRGLVDLGLTGVLVPTALGGAGGGFVEAGLVLEEMSRSVHPGPFMASCVAAPALLLGFGDDEGARELLATIADGSIVATCALLEPGSRWDWRDPSTRAGGDGPWRLDGAKAQVLSAASADVLLVTARGADGIGVFAVDAAAEGVRIEPVATTDPTRRVADVVLDGASARRLGNGDVTAAVAAGLDRITAAACADGLGAASLALELAVEHARTRHQFGRPVGSFQAVQHLCADMLLSIELARAAIHRALWELDAADAASAHRAVAIAAAHATVALPQVGATAIQVLGGVGFTWEHDAHLAYKRLLSMESLVGDTSWHLDEVARLVV